MAATPALLDIETVVTRYLLKYKKTTEDFAIYLEHACNATRDFQLFHSADVVTEKVTINANKWIEMPTDMLSFIDLATPIEGKWWSFTRQDDIVNTTTFTGLIEGRDSDFGEGVDIKHAMSDTYGAKGGVNAYNYMIDWDARRIYVDGISSETIVLKYVSSGVTVGGTTYVPDFMTPVIDTYLLWKESYWIVGLARERQLRERDYTNEVLKARNLINSLSYNELRDILLGSATQTVVR